MYRTALFYSYVSYLAYPSRILDAKRAIGFAKKGSIGRMNRDGPAPLVVYSWGIFIYLSEFTRIGIWVTSIAIAFRNDRFPPVGGQLRGAVKTS